MIGCHFCTNEACAGQFIGEAPVCWNCKATETQTGWVVLRVEYSRASGGVKLHGVNKDTDDRLFRAFVWDLSGSIRDSRYDFSKARIDDDARKTFDRLRAQ